MIKINALLPLCTLFFIMFFSCADDGNVENNTTTTFSLQIVDSLQIDYLGGLYLLDQNNRGEFLLQDAQRDMYLVVNALGAITHQFTLRSDDRDFPGISFESPAFFQDDQIVFHGAKGLYFFDFEGKLLAKSDEPLESQVYVARMGTKAIFEVELGGTNYLVTNNLSYLAGDPNTQSFYDDFRAITLYNPLTQESQRDIPLHPSSIYQDGRKHESSRLLNRFGVFGNKLAISYKQDPQIYLYQMYQDSFELIQILPLIEEVKYLDRQKEREKVEERDGNVRAGFNLGGLKMGESMVGNIALVAEDLVFVQYNPGLPEDVREAAKIIQDGDGIRIENPDNIPRDRYVIFHQGQKAGADEMPAQLRRLSFTKGNFIWFSAEPNEELEEDFVTWYKVQLRPN